MNARRLGWLVRVAAMVAVISTTFSAFAAGDGHDVDARRIPFDVPAQSLELALLQYMEVSGVSVIADSPLMASRRSTELSGIFSAEQGLRQLLSGTGLYPRAIGERAFLLEPFLPNNERQPLPRFASYSALVQQAVIASLCERDETRPTHYRAVMRLWLGQAGNVTRVELDSSTGSRDLDSAITHALLNVAAIGPLPAGLPQPVKLAILPRDGATDNACAPRAANLPSMPVLDR